MGAQRFVFRAAVTILAVVGSTSASAQSAILLSQQGYVDEGEQAEFSVHVDQAGTYIIETFGADDTTLTVKDDANNFSQYDDDGGWRLNARIVHYLTPDEYKVIVGMYAGQAGSYRVVVYNADQLHSGIPDSSVTLPNCETPHGPEFGCLGDMICRRVTDDPSRIKDPDTWCLVRAVQPM